MTTFKERIKDLRLSYNLSVRQLSALTQISKSALSAYECGKREPSYESLEALADVFNCDIDYLLGRSDIKCQLLHGTKYNTLYEAYKDGIDVDKLPSTYSQRRAFELDLQLFAENKSPSTAHDEGEERLLELYRRASPETRKLVASILEEIESYPEESKKMLLGMIRGAFENQ